MIINLLSKQVPQFWDAIKFAATQADEVDEKHMQLYLNELLQALLSDKAQCFVAIDEERILQGLLLTRVLVNKITGEKYLYLQSVYAWKKLDQTIWEDAYKLFRKFAEVESCKYISFQSANPAVWDRLEKLNFTERSRTFELRL